MRKSVKRTVRPLPLVEHPFPPESDYLFRPGSTEATGIVSTWPVNQVRGISGGELIPGTTVRLVKSDGSLAGYDEPGELHVKTHSAAMGYYGNEQA